MKVKFLPFLYLDSLQLLFMHNLTFKQGRNKH